MVAPAVDQAAVAADWKSRGFSCGLWVDPPGQRWENFTHGVDELLIVVEGVLELEIGQRRQRPAIGQEILIPARVLHSVRNVGGSTSRWLYGYKDR